MLTAAQKRYTRLPVDLSVEQRRIARLAQGADFLQAEREALSAADGASLPWPGATDLVAGALAVLGTSPAHEIVRHTQRLLWDLAEAAPRSPLVPLVGEAHRLATAFVAESVSPLSPGTRVEGGETPEDYDTGTVVTATAPGGHITVGWDSGVTTTQAEGLLRPEGTRVIN